MKRLIGLFYLTFISCYFSAQPPTIEWQKSLGGSMNELEGFIQQTSDGGYILCSSTGSNDGHVTGNHGSLDIWLVKLDSLSNISWQKCLGGSNGEIPHSVQQTTDGGYIVCGYTQSNDGDVSGNHGLQDYWVVKLTSFGVIEWQKCLGGSADERAYSIQQTFDGGYILCGFTESNNGDVSGNHGSQDYWVVKLTSFGVIEWQKCLGSNGNDIAYSIQQTIDGGYIMCGYTGWNDGDVSGNHGESDYWIVKIDSVGDITWQKCLGGSFF